MRGSVPRRRRWTKAAAAALLALIAAAPAGAAPLDLSVRPVPLDADDTARTRVGAMEYQGGLLLRASEPRFGGFSGLEIEGDGALVAISDHGAWLTARLVEDAEGRLVGLAEANIAPALDRARRPVVAQWRDAEEVVRLTDGRLAVSFERRHRVWLYPADDPFGGRPAPLAAPPGLAMMPENSGLEAMAEVVPGTLLAVAEHHEVVPGASRGWLWPLDGGPAATLDYALHDGFYPTAFAMLPDGDLLALERRYTAISGPAARLVRIAAETIAPGALLDGRELGRIALPLTVDNFEGLAVRRGADGGLIAYLLSDDNFNPLQRTLLLAFRLVE